MPKNSKKIKNKYRLSICNIQSVNNFGYTMVEILVVIFIITTIFSIVSLNYGEINKGSRFEGTVLKIVSDTRKAQSYSLGLKKHGDDYFPSGWGIYFDTSDSPHEYGIFGNKNDKDEVSGWTHDFIKIETKKLPRPARIENIYIYSYNDDGKPNNCIKNEEQVYITYRPPNPETVVCYNESDNLKCEEGEFPLAGAIIEFNDSDQKTMCLNINQFGLVDFMQCSNIDCD